MKGWTQGLHGHPFEQPKQVIGVVVAKAFPDEKIIREKIEEGIARVPAETVWVLRSPRKKGDAISVAWDVLEEHGIEPLLAPTNTAHWKTHARSWRDAELLNTCERVIVFHDVSSQITAGFRDVEHSVAKVFVIERGQKRKASARKGRKPVGA